MKSGHVSECFFLLKGNRASHVGVFDFSSMTAPLQEEISAEAPNCYWHGADSPGYCLEMLGRLTRAVDRQCQNKEKKSVGTHSDEIVYKCTHILHTSVENQYCTCPPTHTYYSGDAHSHPGIAHVRVSCRTSVCPGWQLSGLLWFQCLDTLPNGPIICSGGVPRRGVAWPRGVDLGQPPRDGL